MTGCERGRVELLGYAGFDFNSREFTVPPRCGYWVSRSSAIVVRAAPSSKGKKSRGPGLLLLEVSAAPTSRPATPPAADMPPSTFDRSLGRARKKYVRPDCVEISR